MDHQISEMYYKSIYFDLPFLVFVKDGFKDKQLEDREKACQNSNESSHSQYAPSNNESGGLTIGGEIPVYIPEKVEKAYVVKVGEKFVGIQFLRRITQNNSVNILNLYGEVEGDRAGRASFSSVRVNFDLRIFEPKDYFNVKYFVNLAIDSLNKFIEHYRVFTGRHYIRPVTPAIVQKFTIFNYFSDKPTFVQHYVTGKAVLDVDEAELSLPPFVFHIDAMMHCAGGVSDEIDVNLREILYKDIEPSIIDTLHLEVKDKLDLREWRLAAIEAAVLFETFLNTRLRDVYRNKGFSEFDVENKFHKNDSLRTPLSSYAIAKNLVKDATGFDFSATSEFQNWSCNTKDLRNDVVHGKKYKVTRDEAQLSYACVVNGINLISKHL